MRHFSTTKLAPGQRFYFFWTLTSELVKAYVHIKSKPCETLQYVQNYISLWHQRTPSSISMILSKFEDFSKYFIVYWVLCTWPLPEIGHACKIWHVINTNSISLTSFQLFAQDRLHSYGQTVVRLGQYFQTLSSGKQSFRGSLWLIRMFGVQSQVIFQSQK